MYCNPRNPADKIATAPIPQPKPKNQEWTCTTCSQKMPLISQKSHLSGRRHTQRLPWTCITCDLTLKISGKKLHEYSRAHLARLAPPVGPGPKAGIVPVTNRKAERAEDAGATTYPSGLPTPQEDPQPMLLIKKKKQKKSKLAESAADTNTVTYPPGLTTSPEGPQSMLLIKKNKADNNPKLSETAADTSTATYPSYFKTSQGGRQSTCKICGITLATRLRWLHSCDGIQSQPMAEKGRKEEKSQPGKKEVGTKIGLKSMSYRLSSNLMPEKFAVPYPRSLRESLVVTVHSSQVSIFWKCDVCDITSNKNIKESHLLGRRHKAKVRAAAWKLEPEPWWNCKTCGITIKEIYRESHLVSRLHGEYSGVVSAAVPEARACPKTETPQETVGTLEKNNPTYWTCTICDVSILESGSFNSQVAHSTGKLHLFRLRAKEVGCPIATPKQQKTSCDSTKKWTCTICDITMQAGSEQSHINGKGHRTKNNRAKSPGKKTYAKKFHEVNREEIPAKKQKDAGASKPKDLGTRATPKAQIFYLHGSYQFYDGTSWYSQPKARKRALKVIASAASEVSQKRNIPSTAEPSKKRKIPPTTQQPNLSKLGFKFTFPRTKEAEIELKARVKKRDLARSRSRDQKSYLRMSCWGFRTDHMPVRDRRLIQKSLIQRPASRAKKSKNPASRPSTKPKPVVKVEVPEPGRRSVKPKLVLKVKVSEPRRP